MYCFRVFKRFEEIHRLRGEDPERGFADWSSR